MWYSSAWGQEDGALMAVYDAVDFIDWNHDELIIYKADNDPVHRSAFVHYLTRKTGGREQQLFEPTQRYWIEPKSALEFQSRFAKIIGSTTEYFILVVYSVFQTTFTSRVWNAVTLRWCTITGPAETT